MTRQLLLILSLTLLLSAPSHGAIVSLDRNTLSLQPGDEVEVTVQIRGFVEPNDAGLMAISVSGALEASPADGLRLLKARGGILFDESFLGANNLLWAGSIWDANGVDNESPRDIDVSIPTASQGGPFNFQASLFELPPAAAVTFGALSATGGSLDLLNGSLLVLTFGAESDAGGTYTLSLPESNVTVEGLRPVPLPPAIWGLLAGLGLLGLLPRARARDRLGASMVRAS